MVWFTWTVAVVEVTAARSGRRRGLRMYMVGFEG